MAPTDDLLRAVRAHFGWTQQTLAEALGVRRTRVAEAENSTRLLPLDALPRLALLVTCLPVVTGLPAPLPPPDAAALRRRRAQCRLQVAKLGRALAQRETQARQAQARYAALPTLTAAPLVAAPAPVAGPAWARAQALEADLLLAEAGPTAQALLRARQAGLEAEIAALTELLGE